VLLCVLVSNLALADQEAERLKQAAAQAHNAGNTQRALELYPQALQADPDWVEGWWQYGGLLSEQDRLRDAAEAFGRLTRLSPQNPLGWASLGLCEYELHDDANARLHLVRALSIPVHMPDEIAQKARFRLGLLDNRAGEFNEALLTFTPLLRQAPDYRGLIESVGAALLHLEEVPAPASSLSSAVQMAGRAARAVLHDDPKEAEQAYRGLIAHFPQQPFAHYHYALFLLDRQRDKEAEGELQEELKFNSSSALPLLCLAQMALDRGDVPRILELTARAHQIEPESFVAYYLDGRSFMKSGDWEQARHSLEEAEGRAPRSAEIHFSLATVYQKLNRPQDAERERALFVRDSAKDRQ